VVFVIYIRKMEAPTPKAIAYGPLPKSATITTATMADTRWPPTRLRGWAKYDSLAEHRRTAEAPKDPIRRGNPAILVTAKMARTDSVPLTNPHMAYFKDLGAWVPLSLPFILPGRRERLNFNYPSSIFLPVLRVI
jgi:hypothetical protein